MVRDARGLGWIGRIITVAILAAIYFGVYATFFAPNLPAPVTPATAEDGDTLQVDYIGWFPDNGRVFDTSIATVARDNASFPKAAAFQWRRGGSYTPLGFTLGCGIGDAQCPLTAFQDAVRGMRIGDTRRFVLQQEDAYGPADSGLIEVRPLEEDVAATRTMSASEFQTEFGDTPVDGLVIADPTWGWNVTVRVSGPTVTIRSSTTPGDRAAWSGWKPEL